MTYGSTGPASGSSQTGYEGPSRMSIASNVSCDSATLASVEPAVAAATVPSLTTGTRVANGTGRWSRRRAVDIVAAVDLAAAVMAGILPLDLGESATLDWR